MVRSTPRPITTIPIPTPRIPRIETPRSSVSRLPALRKPLRKTEKAQNSATAVRSTIFSWLSAAVFVHPGMFHPIVASIVECARAARAFVVIEPDYFRLLLPSLAQQRMVFASQRKTEAEERNRLVVLRTVLPLRGAERYA